ncbi:MAG: outer membrane beta-barrel protein, partial [Gammaproteobacteria bacterium]|nr:outer membrane beta-barrel protein [Gammaproteobacteria bacterium]
SGFTGGYSKQDVRSASEADDEDFIGAQGTQTRWYFNPNYSYNFSPTTTLRLRGGYTDVSYSESTISRFDYDNTTFSTTIIKVINPRSSIAIQGSLSHYSAKQPRTRFKNTSDTDSIALVYQYSFSPALQATLDIGWSNTETSAKTPNGFGGFICSPNPLATCTIDSDGSNFVGNFRLSRITKLTSLSAGISQSISPSSNGTEVVRTTYDSSFLYNISRKLEGNFRVRYYDQDDAGNLTRRKNSRFTINTGVRWKLSRHWSINVSYRYIDDEQQFGVLTQNEGTLKSQEGNLSITYSPQAWRN